MQARPMTAVMTTGALGVPAGAGGGVPGVAGLASPSAASDVLQSGALEDLEGAHADIAAGIGIADLIRVSGKLKAHAEEGKQHGVPETAAVEVAEQSEMIEAAFAQQRGNAAKRFGMEFYVGIGEEQPIAGGELVALLERVRLA